MRQRSAARRALAAGVELGSAFAHEHTLSGQQLERTAFAPPLEEREATFVVEHREVGDVTTLADSSVMDLISKGIDSGKGED